MFKAAEEEESAMRATRVGAAVIAGCVVIAGAAMFAGRGVAPYTGSIDKPVADFPPGWTVVMARQYSAGARGLGVPRSTPAVTPASSSSSTAASRALGTPVVAASPSAGAIPMDRVPIADPAYHTYMGYWGFAVTYDLAADSITIGPGYSFNVQGQPIMIYPGQTFTVPATVDPTPDATWVAFYLYLTGLTDTPSGWAYTGAEIVPGTLQSNMPQTDGVYNLAGIWAWIGESVYSDTGESYTYTTPTWINFSVPPPASASASTSPSSATSPSASPSSSSSAS